MKIIALIVIFCYALPQSAYGQSAKNEAALSVGFFSRYRQQDLQAGVGPMRSASGEAYKRTDISESGAYFLTFQRALAKQFSLGFTLGVEQEHGAFGEQGGDQRGTYRKRSLSFAVEARYMYFSRDLLSLYAMMGIGPHAYQQTTSYTQLSNGVPVMTESAEEFGIAPGYQVSPIGVRYGKQFGGFAEFGYGYKGILNLGASFRF